MKKKPLLYFLKAGNELTKLLRIMRLITIMMIIGIFQVNASVYSQNEVFSFKENGLTMRSVLKTIESKSKFKFFYNDDLTNVDQKVDLVAHNLKINQVLDVVLSGTNLSYKILENNLVIISPSILLQHKMITGLITDAKTGQPLIGVSIKIQGTNKVAITDMSGKYSIDVPDQNAVLIFTYMGYLSESIAVGGMTNIDLQLKPDVRNLEEVVVVGYGTRKKASLTGAVSSVKASDIKNHSGFNVLNALAGQLSGVEVHASSGRPGASPVLRIRGTGSLGAGNAPLYVVDGMPLDGTGDLNQINSDDIETIDVLKEASAAAIYGSRGSNGVIIITTKKGKTGQSQINFSFYTGMQDVPKRIAMNTRDQEITWWKENTAQLWATVGGNPATPNGSRLYNGVGSMLNYLTIFDDPSTVPNTDWQSVVFNNAAPMTNYSLSAQGGTDKIHYFVSGSYQDQSGVVKSTGYKRYTGRMNVDAQVNKYIKVGMNINPSYGKENIRNTDAHINSGDLDASFILGALVQSTSQLPKDPITGVYGGVAGNYNPPYVFSGYAGAANPLQIIEDPLYKKTNEILRLNDVTYLDFEPIKGLVYHSDFCINYTHGVSNWYRPSTVSTVGGGTIVNTGTAPTKANLLNIGSSNGQNYGIQYVWNNTINYQKVINKAHSINLLVGYAYQKAIGESASVAGTLGTYSNDAVQYVSASTTKTGGADKQQWAMLSYFGRANYTFKDKYILDGSIRSDGCSRFGANQKYAIFPAAGFAWRVSQESFMKPITIISDLKIRAGWGKVGNFNIGNYPAIANLSGSNYSFGGILAPGFAPGNIGNVNLTWETTTTVNLGIDLSLLKSRINVSAEYYNRKTTDMLYGLGVPAITGFTSVTSNIGNIQNRGVELTLNTVNIDKTDFQWVSTFIFSRNRNKVLKLGINNADVVAGTTEGGFSTQMYRVGEPMAFFYGYKQGGVFKDQADVDAHPEMRLKNANGVLLGGPGDYKIVDANGDGFITVADKTKLGDPNSDFTYNLSNHFTYKNFDLDIQLQGVKGNDIEFLTARFIGGLTMSWAQLAEVTTNRWKSPSEPGNGLYGKGGGTGTTQVASAETQSDRWLRDGSYMRIRNLTLGYTLPSLLVQKAHVKSLRIYASVENLKTFTSYIGYNPDVDMYGENNVGSGVDYATYPLARTFTLGLNISF